MKVKEMKVVQAGYCTEIYALTECGRIFVKYNAHAGWNELTDDFPVDA